MHFSTNQKARFPSLLVDYLLQEGEFGKNVRTLGASKLAEMVAGPEENCVLGERAQAEGESVKLEVKPYWLWDKKHYWVGSIRQYGEDLQLFMSVLAVLPNGQERELKVLIDTGAQANLIRTGLVSKLLMGPAAEPINLRTANGQKMEGGTQNVTLTLGFRRVVHGAYAPALAIFPATFYDADIYIDAILSYPWLVSQGLGVFPHLRALAALEPEFSLLRGLPKNWKRRSQCIDNNYGPPPFS